MARKSKAELDAKRVRFLQLKQLTDSKGWPIFKEILTEEFCAAIARASESPDENERAEARGTIKFIKKMTDSISSEMGFGELAQRQYVEQYVNPPKGA